MVFGNRVVARLLTGNKMRTGRWRIAKILFLLLIMAVLIEVMLRLYGFGSPLLYERTNFGYRVRPHQDLKRFGNHLYYNERGMRSDEISAIPVSTQVRILCLGDSITFGGVQTDQAKTYPELLKTNLGGGGYEVLNVSAGGWAPDNEWGWLRQNGLYGSKLLLLEIGTNDLMQPMSSGDVVDVHPSFPSHNPVLATQELVYRYLLPRLGLLEATDPGAQVGAGTPVQVLTNLNTVKDIVNFARASGAEVVILRIEEPAFMKDAAAFAAASRQLDELAASMRVLVIKPDAQLKLAGYEKVFRGDMIHPNAAGNEVIAGVVSHALATALRGQSSGLPAN